MNAPHYNNVPNAQSLGEVYLFHLSLVVHLLRVLPGSESEPQIPRIQSLPAHGDIQRDPHYCLQRRPLADVRHGRRTDDHGLRPSEALRGAAILVGTELGDVRHHYVINPALGVLHQSLRARLRADQAHRLEARAVGQRGEHELARAPGWGTFSQGGRVFRVRRL